MISLLCSAEQFVDRGPNVRPQHQRFADQNGVDAASARRSTSARVRIPDHRRPDSSRGLRPQPERVVEVGVEGAQVTVVDADERRPCLGTRGKILRVIELHAAGVVASQ